jgi:hypothetical protein
MLVNSLVMSAKSAGYSARAHQNPARAARHKLDGFVKIYIYLLKLILMSISKFLVYHLMLIN